MADIPQDRVKFIGAPPPPPPQDNTDTSLTLVHGCGAKLDLPVICPNCYEPCVSPEIVEQLAYAVANLQQQVRSLQAMVRKGGA